jgi:hypothetical protein
MHTNSFRAPRSGRRRRLVAWSALGAWLSLLPSATAYAEPADPNRSPFDVAPAIEISLVLAVGVGAMLPRVLIDELGPPPCRPDCDAEAVNDFDRWVIGNRSPTMGTVSDVAFSSSLALPYALSALDAATSAPADGAVGWAEDNLVLFETMMFSLATANVTQFVFARPRPMVYDAEHFSEEERFGDTHMLSFPAGHVAANFAMATTYAWIYTARSKAVR